MNNRILKGVTAGLLSAAMLSACGGGGSGTPPVRGGGTSSKTATVSLSFTVPGKNSAIAKIRRSRNSSSISPSTLGLGVSVVAHGGTFPAPLSSPQLAVTIGSGVTANNVNCTTAAGDGSFTCALLIAAPVGYDDFQFSAWDSAATSPGYGGTFAGSMVAFGTLSNQLVELNQQNTIGIALDGVVYSADAQVTPNTLVSGAASGGGVNPTNPTLTVYAKDADGNIIVGPNPYVDANGTALDLRVNVTNNAASAFPTNVGTVLLGGAAFADFTAPGQASTVTYDGKPLASASLMMSAFTGSPTGSLIGSSIAFTQSPGGLGFPGTPTINEYAAVSPNGGWDGIATGPDGNVWYTEQSANKVARYTPGGTPLELAIPAPGAPKEIVPGGDGDMWFITEGATSQLGRIDLAHGMPTNASVTMFGTPTIGHTGNLAEGPDGNLYVTLPVNDAVLQAKIAAPNTLNYCSTSGGANADAINAGPDGHTWFTEKSANKIGYFSNPGGACAEVDLAAAGATGSNPEGIVTGPDGNLWIVEENPFPPSYVGYYNVGLGTFTECPTSTLANQYSLIAAGPDGALYLTSNGFGASIARVTTACSALEFSTGLAGFSRPGVITLGPSPVSPYTANGGLWFLDENNNGAIGSIQP